MTSGQIKLYLFLSLCHFFTISDYQCMMVKKNIFVSDKPHGQGEDLIYMGLKKNIFVSDKPHGQGEDLIYMGLKFKFKHLNFHRFYQAMQPKPINYTLSFYLLNLFLSPSHR